jgi:hypothetical protein
MGRIWDVYGTYMGRIWDIYGTYYPWTMSGGGSDTPFVDIYRQAGRDNRCTVYFRKQFSSRRKKKVNQLMFVWVPLKETYRY